MVFLREKVYGNPPCHRHGIPPSSIPNSDQGKSHLIEIMLITMIPGSTCQAWIRYP